jgi:hypothetical protein
VLGKPSPWSLLFLATIALAACSSANAPAPLDPGTATVAGDSGDWDDIAAAVGYAAGRNEMALLHAHLDASGPAQRRVFELITIRDEPVIFEVVRSRHDAKGGQGPGVAGEPPSPPDAAAREDGQGVALTLRCRVGAFGDPKREAAFIRAFERRLGDLEGVDVAPIR